MEMPGAQMEHRDFQRIEKTAETRVVEFLGLADAPASNEAGAGPETRPGAPSAACA